MKIWIKAMGLTAALASSPIMAGEVNQANVNTFSSGTAASASEVNQNFNALITAIDDNAQRLTALEDGNTVDAANFPGNFAMVGTGAETSSTDVSIDILDGDLTFNGDGTFSLAIQESSISMNGDSGPVSDSLTGTWSLGTAGALTLTLDSGGSFDANVAAGGDILIFDEQGSYHAIRIAVRKP